MWYSPTILQEVKYQFHIAQATSGVHAELY
jgi:hypothetical protein